MNKKTRNKFVIGNWYKDDTGDFIKFNGFNEDSGYEYVKYSACVSYRDYYLEDDEWSIEVFENCTPMTIDEMKAFLPEEEWWVTPSNDLFPIY
jgi:hypothetical protein